MAELSEIVGFLNTNLRVSDFVDSSLNGLQVQGSSAVSKVAVAVDAGQAVIDSAVKIGAQALIVHHGLFWGKPLAITGAHHRAISTLINHNLSLLTYHLPLDAHALWGNNFTLARLLGLENVQAAFPYHGKEIGCIGELQLSQQKTCAQLTETLQTLDGAATKPQLLNFGPEYPHRVGIISGAGADALYELPRLGVDTFITGEPRQFAYHFARDHQLNVIFAGHYATETLGVKELGKALLKEFKTEWIFIDIPTGI